MNQSIIETEIVGQAKTDQINGQWFYAVVTLGTLKQGYKTFAANFEEAKEKFTKAFENTKEVYDIDYEFLIVS